MLAGVATQAGAAELVMFETPACPWCAAWDREIGAIYEKTEEGRRAPLRRIDMSAPRPEGLEQVKGVTYSPTFVLMAEGAEVGRIVGYPGEDFFWPMLQGLLAKLAEASNGDLAEWGG